MKLELILTKSKDAAIFYIPTAFIKQHLLKIGKRYSLEINEVE